MSGGGDTGWQRRYLGVLSAINKREAGGNSSWLRSDGEERGVE